jgi:lipopolysaccharide/colanic/teichoic acid biosynthesis glycosyltransferase
LDIVISGLALLVLAPLFILISLGIVFSAKSSPFFFQNRIGRNGETFRIIKFQTMVPNAEHMGAGVHVEGEADDRITKIGRILRRTSIDELPQLVNVLQGAMSLVGPRPPVTYIPYDGYKNYPEWAKKRFEVMPGITGWSQVINRNAVTWDEAIKYDNEYVDRLSFAMDCKIIFRTIEQVFKPDGIYNSDT